MRDETDREQAQFRLALLDAVLAAGERRHEVVEAVWASADRAEAGEKLRVLLALPEGTPPEVVLDLPLGRLTQERRLAMVREVEELRRALVTD